MTCYLYVITNLVNHKQYYGWAKNYKKRWSAHRCGRGSELVYNAIKKYGLENFKFKIVCKASEQECKRLEIGMIKVKHSQAPNGYNISEGGDGAIGCRHTERAKKKISIARIGRKLSEETKKKMSIAQTGRKHPNTKPILVNGIKYGCIKDAAIAVGHLPDTLRKKFRRFSKNNNFPSGWKYL